MIYIFNCKNKFAKVIVYNNTYCIKMNIKEAQSFCKAIEAVFALIISIIRIGIFSSEILII